MMTNVEHFIANYIRRDDLQKTDVKEETLFKVLDNRISETSIIRCDRYSFSSGYEVWTHGNNFFTLTEKFDIIDDREITLPEYQHHAGMYPIEEYPVDEAIRQARLHVCKFIEDYARKYGCVYENNTLVQWRDPDYRYVFLCWFDNHGNVMIPAPSWFNDKYIRDNCIAICYSHLEPIIINKT